MSGPTTAYELPARARGTLARADVRLVLHSISFSHYCERARWSVRLLGIPFEQVGYLPLQHIPAILRLQREFGQGPGKPTASSKSPAATPVLAIYSASGERVCLLQDSALICRYAALRAAALQLPSPVRLYGQGLALQEASEAPAAGGASSAAASAAAAPPGPADAAPAAEGGVGGEDGPQGAAAAAAAATGGGGPADRIVGGDAAVEALELRLAGTLGVEVRRVAYFHLLPTAVGSQLFVRNHQGSALVARLVYGACRLLLPRLLNINAATAARGRELLLQEFDYLDGLLLEQQQQQQQRQRQPAGSGSAACPLSYYLTGPTLTAADVSLACLAAPLLCVPAEHCQTWTPPMEELPAEARSLCEELRQRPTGRFVLDLWRCHGPMLRDGPAAS